MIKNNFEYEIFFHSGLIRRYANHKHFQKAWKSYKKMGLVYHYTLKKIV